MSISSSTVSHMSISRILKKMFVNLGVLPVLVVVSIITFTLAADNFLSSANLVNVLRQSVYLTIVSLGQMLVLLTGGFDLSVGTALAISSVVGALAMSTAFAAFPSSIVLVIIIGCVAGILAAGLIGAINGVGVGFFNVSPFMMSLGMASVGFGIALYLTGGVPIYGMPQEFGDTLGFGELLGVPYPLFFVVAIIILLVIFLYRTRYGRYLYAVGGNLKAASLSGVSTRLTLFWAYVLCSLLTGISGVLLTARIDTGEANIGASMPLESIAACVIAGVSLRGGIGRVESVVLGALFVGLVQNGMNLAQMDSYLQTVVLGILLILAVVADRLKSKYLRNLSK